MRQIDKIYLEHPTFGSRRMSLKLEDYGQHACRSRVQRLMRRMGIQAVYAKPKTSQPHPENTVYPYRLKGMEIERPMQVWATDITYIPMRQGFMYLVAVIDWYSRAVLSWRVSNTMDTDFCVEALEEALQRYGAPEVFNSDQGAQFTSKIFTERLLNAGVSISMDGRGRWRDNVIVERLWRSVKHECLYLTEVATGHELKQLLREWFRFYNEERPHSGVGNCKPMEVFKGITLKGEASPKTGNKAA